MVGQVEVPAGQVNFRDSLPRLVSYVLEPVLHPDYAFLFQFFLPDFHEIFLVNLFA